MGGGAHDRKHNNTVYMLWSGCRKLIAKQWDLANAVPWDSCQSGCSALSATLLRAGHAEIAIPSGEHFAAC